MGNITVSKRKTIFVDSQKYFRTHGVQQCHWWRSWKWQWQGM